MFTSRSRIAGLCLGIKFRYSREVIHPVVIMNHMNSLYYNRRSTIRLYSNNQQFEFQAETKNLLNIVAKSLYSHSEVFIRELVSNASDALEKRRCAELAGQIAEGPREILICTDEKKHTITFEDCGIGMDRTDLINCLGTIARSGSKEFIEKNKDNAEMVIGQFGVGFYSAFMVADAVTVTSRKVGSSNADGFKWKWNGGNMYEISEAHGLPTGTRIEIYLKAGDAAEFSNEDRVKEVIDKYSYFISAPILLNGKRINSLNAIWTMHPRDVTKEMHESFFKQLVKLQNKLDLSQQPSYTIHYKIETPVSLRSVLYIPQHSFTPLDFATHSVMESGLNLYASRVLIKRNAEELIPRYLRFIIGVVDSEDIPLNLSRELLQNNSVLKKLRKILTDKVINFLANEMKKDPIKYSEFYKQYNLFLKEGVVTETDHRVKEDVAKLMLFESSGMKAGVVTNLTDYCNRMQDVQKEIYYMYAPNRELANSSPYFEVVKSQNKEVIFLYDPADEVVFLALDKFNMKKLVPIEKWAQQEVDKGENIKSEGYRDSDIKELLIWIKNTLGSVKVFDITSNNRMSEHPVMLTVKHEMGAARHFLRTGEVKDMEHLVYFQPTLHVNVSHPLIKSLFKLIKADPLTAELLVEQIYDNALITSGLIRDTSRMVQRLNKLLTKLSDQDKSVVISQ